MKLTYLLGGIFVCSSVLFSCDRPACTNNNPVFDKYHPDSKEYKTELVKEIRKVPPGSLRYWIDKYIEKDSKVYMSIYIQGGGLCARSILDISDTNVVFRMKYYKQVKGGGYSGAELSGLEYRIDSTDGGYNFIFKNVDHIID